MAQTYLEVQLMNDPARLARLSTCALAGGALLVCDRCGNANEIIAAILHIPDLEGTWSLCGPCLREFPCGATIV